jgi:predicted dinucleotide-binding enzyme
MKVGILGSGMVGQTLGAGFAAKKHSVMLGTRDPAQEKVQAWIRKTGSGVRAGTPAEAAKFGEIVILATAWSGAEDALRLASPQNLAGKVVMDVTNPLEFQSGAPTLSIGCTESAGERVQRWLPGAKVVKALNTVTAATMISPTRQEGTPDMFIAGNDAEAKGKVTAILREFGWPVIDLGGIEESRLLEPLAMIWIKYYMQTGTGTHAFKLLKK